MDVQDIKKTISADRPKASKADNRKVKKQDSKIKVPSLPFKKGGSDKIVDSKAQKTNVKLCQAQKDKNAIEKMDQSNRQLGKKSPDRQMYCDQIVTHFTNIM